MASSTLSSAMFVWIARKGERGGEREGERGREGEGGGGGGERGREGEKGERVGEREGEREREGGREREEREGERGEGGDIIRLQWMTALSCDSRETDIHSVILTRSSWNTAPRMPATISRITTNTKMDMYCTGE